MHEYLYKVLRSEMCLQAQNKFLHEYLNQRHDILIELLRHESFPSMSLCTNCQQMSGMYRCRDCFGTNIWCGPCCVSTHAMAPFHRIQMWNGAFFERLDILMHELTLELHHYPNNCPSFQPNAESQMIFEDISDDSDEFTDGYQPSDPSGPSAHHGS
jgi:hypothetical protein